MGQVRSLAVKTVWWFIDQEQLGVLWDNGTWQKVQWLMISLAAVLAYYLKPSCQLLRRQNVSRRGRADAADAALPLQLMAAGAGKSCSRHAW